jgi:uroporphyrinogen III methyltransferase/synthase
VVVTRAADRQEDLAALLEARGATVVRLPLVVTVVDDAVLGRLAALLADTEWVAVTSVNGAFAVRRAMAGPTVPSHVRVAAVGPATAAALGRCDLIPEVHSARGLADALAEGQGRRILVVEAATAAPTLVDVLTAQGWEVTVVAPHRTVDAAVDADTLRAATMADAVIFTSGSAAGAWARATAGTDLPATTPLLVAMGPQTAADAAHEGLKISLVSADHSLDGITVAMDTLSPPVR